jgi:lipopolysaccharide transport system ATP-binding protein
MIGEYYWPLKKRLMTRLFNTLERSTYSEGSESIFHITHPKAGSQWIKDVISAVTYKRTVRVELGAGHLLNQSLKQGYYYPTLYINQDQFNQVIELNKDISYRAFYVSRDLRDTLISLYFSLKHSHKLVSDNVQNQRSILSSMTDKEGLKHLIENGLQTQSKLQMSWANSNIKMFRYEDFILNQKNEFKKLFEFCDIMISDKKLGAIVKLHDFKSMTSGRSRGEEDISQHQRKGISGDWKNYFDDEIKDLFKEKYGAILIATGYEKDLEW